MTTIKLPVLDFNFKGDANSFAAGLLASEEKRWIWVRQAAPGIPEPPDGSPWLESPLTLWCWFVLKANDLDVDPDEHHPLVHWGIDLTWANDRTREFVWMIS